MNKEQMKARLNDLEEQISYMTVQAAKLAAFIKSPEFRGLPDIEATLVIQQNHLIAAYYRTLTLQAALLGGMLQDPEGDKAFVNDETPSPVLDRVEGEINTNTGHAVGNTIIQEGN